MPTSTVTAKGQITLPQAVRNALDLRPGDKVDFVDEDGEFRLVPVRGDIKALKGRFAGRVAKPVTLEEMDCAIADGAADSAAAGNH